MSETELQEYNQKRRETYNMSEEGRQEKNEERREKYKPYVPIKLKADKGDVDAQWRLAWAYADGKLGWIRTIRWLSTIFRRWRRRKTAELCGEWLRRISMAICVWR